MLGNRLLVEREQRRHPRRLTTSTSAGSTLLGCSNGGILVCKIFFTLFGGTGEGGRRGVVQKQPSSGSARLATA
jgi:hypothetical protein